MNYLIVGTDAFLREQKIKELISKHLPPDDSFNVNTYYADSDSVTQILSSLATIPFNAKYRVVVIKNSGEIDADGLKAMTGYFKNPSGTSVAIFESEAKPGKAAWGEILKSLKVTDLNTPSGRDLQKWLEAEVAQCGKQITKEAAELFLGLLEGEQLIRLKNELDKIKAYASFDQTITVEHVRVNISRAGEQDIFKIVNAIADKNAQKALSAAAELMETSVRPQEIMGLIAWHYRKIYQATRNPAVIRKASNRIGTLLNADRDSKTGLLSANTALELAIIRLCSASKEA